MNAFATTPWFLWGLALALGFPLAAILLANGVRPAERRSRTLGQVVRTTLNVMLPLVVLYLFLRFVVGQASEAVWVRITLTAVLIAGIHLVLGFVNAWVFGRQDADPARIKTPKLLRDLVQVVLVAIGGAIVLSNVWGQDVGGLFTALGVGSIVLGLALQETLGNVMSGIALLMERPFGEGDWVRFDLIEGRVDQINWRAVRVVDRAGDTIIVPHSVAGRGIVVNTTLPRPTERNRIELSFSHVHPPNAVKAMLQEALEDNEDILEDPPASVSTFGYLAEAVVYSVVFHVGDPTLKFKARETFMTRVWYAAQRHGIGLALPVRRVTNVDDFQAPGYAAREAITGLTASSMLRAVAGDEAAVERLVNLTRLELFARGETIVHQGDFEASLRLLVDGEAQVLRRGARTGRVRELMRLEHGDFFGEIALFTGAASPYTVVAESDLRTLRLEREAVDLLVAARPALKSDIGRVMDIRRRAVAGQGDATTTASAPA